MRRIIVATLICLAVMNCREAGAAPVVFWVSEPVSPGDVVMVYGGDLHSVQSVEISRLPDVAPQGAPQAAASNATRDAAVPVLQASDYSLKFILPKSFAPGVFALRYGGNFSRLIDAPQVYWCQTTRLLPGLEQNEAAPGSSIQIIGRNFVPASKPGIVRVVLRGGRGYTFETRVTQIDKYSIVAVLPPSLPLGTYKILVHNGYGGPTAWSEGLTLIAKQAAVWPASLSNVKAFGAIGDNVHDDSAALRKVLAAAKNKGGGIIYFPAGTYRLNGWFQIPHRVVLRGEARNLVWLKWPLAEPASAAEIIPSVLYTSGEFGIENLSFMVRNAQTIVRDLSWDAATTGRTPLPGLQSELLPPGKEHDIFLRNVDFQLLYYSGRPAKPESSPGWKLNGFGWKNGDLIRIVAIDEVQNLEISNCRFVGGTQRVLDLDNALLERNEFNNQWATLSWTDLGGQYIVFQNNKLVGASSWRPNHLPVRYLYCAFNRSANLVAGEREALTFDINQVLPRSRAPLVNGYGTQAVAWQGRALSGSPDGVQLQNANLLTHAYRGLELLILDGRGAGQQRTITDNTGDRVTVSPAWDVTPDATSLLLAYQLSGDCILYRNYAEDTSVLLQIWGFLYDVTFDGNDVERSQGMWGLSGWLVQWLNNRLNVAVTFHQGVGPGGDSPQDMTPERSASYGVLGFSVTGRMSQLPLRFPYVRGCVLRTNHLSYGHRVLMRFGYNRGAIQLNPTAIEDVVIDANQIDHSPVGVEVDGNAEGVLLTRNSFSQVAEQTRLAAPQRDRILQKQFRQFVASKRQ